MYPLIEIKTVPIEIQFKIKNATLEYSRGTAEMEISRSDKGLDIKSRPIKLQLDTFEPSGAVTPNVTHSAGSADSGRQQGAYEATSAYVQPGKLTLNARLGQDAVSQLSAGQTGGSAVQTDAANFLPQGGSDVQWEDGEMEIQYEMDKLNFDWKIDNGEFKFTPGDIEFSVEQQPEVIIRYLGGPLYVPASADPNYQPVDVKA